MGRTGLKQCKEEVSKSHKEKSPQVTSKENVSQRLKKVSANTEAE